MVGCHSASRVLLLLQNQRTVNEIPFSNEAANTFLANFIHRGSEEWKPLGGSRGEVTDSSSPPPQIPSRYKTARGGEKGSFKN